MIYTWVHFKKFFVKISRLKTEKRKGDAEKFLKLVDNEESEAAEARPGWHRNKGGNDISQSILTYNIQRWCIFFQHSKIVPQPYL